MKKIISIVLTMCLIATVFLIPTSVSATGGANIKSNTSLQANAGSSISVPVYIENNPGIMGYVLQFKYDNSVLAPTSVTQGEALTGGNFNDDIEGSTSTENSFKVMWNNSENASGNGVLFYLNFDVDSTATASTIIEVSYDEDDTYNEDLNNVELNCSDIDITFNNSTYDTLSKFKLSSTTASVGDTVALSLTVENTDDLTAAIVNVAYDNKNFEFVSTKSNLGSATVTAKDENSILQLQLNGLSVDSNGKNIELTFKSFEYATSGKYAFAVSCEKQGDNEVGLGYNGTVTLNATATSDSAVISSDETIVVNKGTSEVTIPIYIKHNTGIMGYRLNFTYNTSELAVVSANGVVPFAGNFYNSIGNKAGEFYCIWYANEDVTADGKLMEIKFNVVSENETTSTIGVSYSQADTFNEAKDDVKFSCNDIDVIVNHTHVFGEWETTKAATCTEKGSKVRYCTICDASETAEIEALGHDYDNGVITKAPTCTEKGYTTYTCSRCKDSYVADYVDAKGHKYDSQVTKEATCTEKGIRTYTCEHDHTHAYTEDIPALGHDYKTVVTPPTCTEKGYTTYTCSRCKDSYVADYVDALGHDYESEVTKEPTCTEKGIRTYTCKHDKTHTYTEEIPALGHNYKASVVEPTCTDDGYTIYTCERCKDTYISDYVDASGHDFESEVTKEPTCTEKGVRTYTCKHDHTHTYTEDIPALGHDYKAVVTPPTCTEKGYTTYTCSRCKDSYVSDYVEALGHEYESEVTKEPTCTETGVRTYTCKHDHTHTYTETISALGHNYIAVVTPPTCTEQGYTTYTCSRCKDSYISDYKTPLGHDFDDGVVAKEPTCTEKGIRTFTCKHDKTHTYTEEIPALGHDYVSVITPPTCTEKGFTTYTCSHCKDSYVADYVEALGHDYESEVTKEPTCTEKGIRTYTCKHDKTHTFTEDIPALGHDYKAVVTSPTCTEKGYITYTCSHCGDTYIDNYVDALGHQYDDGVVTKYPTTTSTGIMTYTCLNDPSHTYTEVIPKLSSTPTEEEANNATVNKSIKKPSGITTLCNTKKKQMTIKFKAVSGAINYRIAYRKAGAKKWTLKWTNGKTTYVLKNLKSKELYEFKLAAYKVRNGSWERGNWSNTNYVHFYKLTQKNPKAYSKSIKVFWDRDKSATGYVIFYSTNKSMSGKKKITVKGNNKTSYTIKNLKKGKRYYISIGSYKVKSGKTYNGELSSQKNIKSK